jgi:hypothetical protein
MELLGEWVMWNLVLVRLEIVLVSVRDMMRTSSTISRWQRRNKKRPSGLVVVGRRPCEPLNNPTLLSLGEGSHLKRESHPSPIGLVF